jgi:cytochrome c5
MHIDDAPSLPQATGREAVVTMCSGCHGLETSVSSRHSRAEWQELVQSMRDRGAPGSDEDIRAAVDYLARYFGR